MTRLLDLIKSSPEHDFEWYPTTEEIIEAIKADMVEKFKDPWSYSIIDCGAGDGRVLKALVPTGKKMAIEKSRRLLDSLDSEIVIVGTNFHEQTLIDKKADVIFCNPPFSEFSQWATKIIREGNAEKTYLVLPERWKDDSDIAEAITHRGTTVSTLLTTTFSKGERAARVKVDVIRLDNYSAKDPFSLWFKAEFKIKASNDPYKTKKRVSPGLDKFKSEKSEGGLVKGSDHVQALVNIYQTDLQEIISTYKKLESINAELLSELDVKLHNVLISLKAKIKNLKAVYWQEIFNRLALITNKLSSSKRARLLNELATGTCIDFDASNVYGVASWVAKNANIYFDEQLVEVYERILQKGSVVNYKSNKLTFGDDEWRYCRKPKNLSHVGLDYRIVLENKGGYTGEGRFNGLHQTAFEIIGDIRVLAGNLGFFIDHHADVSGFEWERGKEVDFMYTNLATGDVDVLMSVRAYLNGNIHIKFNQAFIRCLNVEFGRLKGWLRSKEEAAEELNIPVDEVNTFFKKNDGMKIKGSPLLAITYNEREAA